MPYIITTTTPEHHETLTVQGRNAEAQVGATIFETVTRHAVATLDEAQEAAANELYDHAINPGRTSQQAFYDGVADLPEAGGTVGPLPDGTVIEVERVGWSRMIEEIQKTDPAFMGHHDERVFIDAYNAAQEA